MLAISSFFISLSVSLRTFETLDFENSVDAVNVTEEPNDQSHLTAEQISFIPDDTKKRSRKQNIEERRTF